LIRTKDKKNEKQDNSFLKWVLISVIVLIAGYFASTYFLDGNKKREVNKQTTQKQEVPEPPFKKQGTLDFLNAKEKTIKSIDIEIAGTDSARMMGLMYRKSMTDEQGMLFIFENSEPRSFWMKNTIIPLDIIYINENKEIVSIAKKTKPYSTESIPSGKNAQYVVEVNGGFTDKYEIKAGDKIKYTKEEKK
jgi:uncharacterized protein